jgi:putative glutamine amidotransferase
MNVALGGSLVQHVPAVTGRDHYRKDLSLVTVHGVRVTPGSMLAGVVGATNVEVNSLHHQAVDRLGDGLRAVAWSDDGVVEGVEAALPARLLGVQWHPELLPGLPAHDRLLDWLVTEAGRPAADTTDQVSDTAA